MEAKLSSVGHVPVLHHNCHYLLMSSQYYDQPLHKHRRPNRPLFNILNCVLSSSSPRPADKSSTKLTAAATTTTTSSCRGTTVVYKDNWFDRIAIHHLSRSLQETTGLRSRKSGYDGLVEAAGVAYRMFDSGQQQLLVIQTLEKAFPRPILSAIRALLPQSKFAREYFAVFTTIFFAWLIGPCEVTESELDGAKEKNVVHIKKCRFLEGTNCVGMCTNLCKMPSQVFIKDSLGMPLNMVPNFDDMSCDMIFGQEPPLPINDPAFAQPCFKLCQEKKKNHKICKSQ